MDLIVVGKITGTHHLKGAVKIISNINDLNTLVGNKVMLESTNKSNKILTVEKVSHMNDKKWIVEFVELNDKSDADSIQGFDMKIRKDILNINEDEFLINDIIGLKVITITNESLGEVTDIYETAAHDIYIIEDEEFETLIPDVEVFIKNIDFDKKIMTVSIIDGMRERKKLRSY